MVPKRKWFHRALIVSPRITQRRRDANDPASDVRATGIANMAMNTDTLRVSVLIPVFNEEQTVMAVLENVRIQEVDGVEFEVIVVDDGSTDGSGELLASRPEMYDRLVRLDRNQGKGAAVRAGLGVATGQYVLFQDADLEYHPSHFAQLVFPIREFGADVVMGSRLLAPPFTRVHYFWHKVGNRFITFFFNLLNNTTFTDVYSCYLVYRRSLLDPVALRTDGWEQHAEILSKAVRAGTVFYEVPITYAGRTYAEGKKIRAIHVLAILFTMIRERLRTGSD